MWAKPSPSGECNRGSIYLTPSEGFPCSSGRKLPRSKLTQGWFAPAPGGRKKVGPSGSQGKWRGPERSQIRRYRFQVQLGQQANLFQLWDSAMGRHQAVHQWWSGWGSARCGECRHWAASTSDGTQRASAWANYSLWFWAICFPFLKPSFLTSRMNAWTTCIPVPVSL